MIVTVDDQRRIAPPSPARPGDEFTFPSHRYPFAEAFLSTLPGDFVSFPACPGRC
jgi:hypothetical protein